MCYKRTLKNMVGTDKTETVTGILRETNTLDGKPLFHKRK